MHVGIRGSHESVRRQYNSLGNLSENPKSLIFLMNYANLRRIKLWGNARVVGDDQSPLDHLPDSTYVERPERAIVFDS